MRFTRIGLVLLAVWLLAAPAGMAVAQEGEGLSDVLTDLLRGSEGAGPTAGPDRRIPFGREEIQMSFAPLVKETAPAVVNVYASKKPRETRSPFEGDPVLRAVLRPADAAARAELAGFGRRGRRQRPRRHEFPRHPRRRRGEGRDVRRPRIRQQGAAEGRIARPRRPEDRCSPEPFPIVPIGDSDALEVGDLVLAVGNPFGVGQTTTSGIVSALARSHVGVSDFGFFIQTDAAINPGNSGGALINMAGQLVGINTAIFSRSGGSIGIGFAIPSNMVRAVTSGCGRAAATISSGPISAPTSRK